MLIGVFFIGSYALFYKNFITTQKYESNKVKYFFYILKVHSLSIFSLYAMHY
ncbi:hypothetical protein Echvi_2224 [Echinicola vietnamensis DSM 17526]|uniref:Uncharacterized protein n=1 Tax=Echinicola vietnamensis (strain DSM 17526 / LMG 23754 / KMM 6221) TaxID=926556 RepID=L0FX50_ECHVK|nr:hypothetical protein Echvi_2224 [Echinicola vietnamensis DSM 17526]